MEVLEEKVTFMGSSCSRHPCDSDAVTKSSATRFCGWILSKTDCSVCNPIGSSSMAPGAPGSSSHQTWYPLNMTHPPLWWMTARETDLPSWKTQSIKRTWLTYIYLVWSLSYQQWRNSLCDVRFVLTNGCIRPGAMGSYNACQTEVAIAYHMVSFTVSPRGHPEILREALCSSSWVFLLQISVFLVSLFSIFIYYPRSSFSFIFLSFVPLSPSLPSFLVSPISVI